VIDTIIKPIEPQKIEVINFNKIEDYQMAEDTTREPTKQDSTPQPIVKPSPPPGRVIKESEDPKKVR